MKSKKILEIKSIEYAPSNKVYRDEKFVHQFMKKIFGIKSYLLSDESSIHDFDFQFLGTKISHDSKKYLKKINDVYKVDVSDIKGLILYKILNRIQGITE